MTSQITSTRFDAGIVVKAALERLVDRLEHPVFVLPVAVVLEIAVGPDEVKVLFDLITWRTSWK